MRCPKCGYISFDHLDTCGKCNKDLSVVSESFDGGLDNTKAPLFLVINSEADVVGDQFVDSETDVLSDPFDLAEDDGDDVISLDDNDSEIEFFVADEDDTLEADSDFEIEEPDTESFEDEDEIVLDFDQDDDLGDLAVVVDDVDEGLDDVDIAFDDDEAENADSGFVFDEFSDDELPDDEIISLSLPDELADISDLSAPIVKDDDFPKLEVASPVEMALPVAELDMKLGDLDLDLSSFEEALAPSEGDDVGLEMSLDGIDFPSAVFEEVDTSVDDGGVIDMNSNLDFELDLDGITLREDK